MTLQPHYCIQITATNRVPSLSFVAAITVVAWSSYVQVENKILEKFGAKSVGCREAFRKRTTPIFLASVILFGISVTSFVTAFFLIGYIKPCTQPPNPQPLLLTLPKGSKPPTLLKSTSYGLICFQKDRLREQQDASIASQTVRSCSRTHARARTHTHTHTHALTHPSAYWVEIAIESDFFPYTLPMSIASTLIFFFAVAASVCVR
jgi:hypothetical protein